MFEGYWGKAGRCKFLCNEHSCCCSRQGPWQVLKDVSKQNGGEYEPDSFGSWTYQVGSASERCHIPLSSATSDTTPLFLLVNKHRLNFHQCLYSCSVCTEWFTWKLPSKPAKHQKLDANRLKDLCVFFRSHWSNSFIHLTFKLNKVSPSLFLRTFYEETCCTLQISGIWGLYVQFLLETNKMLLYLGFDALQSLMTVPLELKSLTPPFESRDIINILPTSFFSVRTVS